MLYNIHNARQEKINLLKSIFRALARTRSLFLSLSPPFSIALLQSQWHQNGYTHKKEEDTREKKLKNTHKCIHVYYICVEFECLGSFASSFDQKKKREESRLQWWRYSGGALFNRAFGFCFCDLKTLWKCTQPIYNVRSRLNTVPNQRNMMCVCRWNKRSLVHWH